MEKETQFTIEEVKDGISRRKDLVFMIFPALLLPLVAMTFVPLGSIQSRGTRLVVPFQFYLVFIWLLAYVFVVVNRSLSAPKAILQMKGESWKKLKKEIKAPITYWLHLLFFLIWLGLLAFIMVSFKTSRPFEKKQRTEERQVQQIKESSSLTSMVSELESSSRQEMLDSIKDAGLKVNIESSLSEDKGN